MDKRFQGKTCPFCKTPFKEDDVIVVCSVCEMPHHLSCWQENNGCTTFGCTGTIKETIGNVTNNNVSPATSPAAVQPVQEKPVQKSEQPARRFETLFENEPNTIQEDVPVLIEKLSLIIDQQNESLMARCIFRSLTDKPIMALLVDVVCTDVWGKKAQSVEGFQFLDLKTKRDSTFGQTKPIPIPDPATRAIEVVIKKVLYTDRTMVDASTDISVLPKQESLESFFASAELAKEYARESNDRAKYTTVVGDHYWRCACGAVNGKEDGTCYRCHADKTQLLGLLNVELISGNLAAFNEEKRLKAEREQAEREEQLRQAEERMRLAQEEKERKEKEEAERKAEELRQKKAKRKKTVKRTSLITAAVLLVGFLVYATGWHIIPYIRYLDAKALFESGSYKEAADAFTALSNYSDSSDQANASNYHYGLELLENGEYENAYTVFKALTGYEDSKDQANESEYLYGIERFDAGDYEKAVAAFKLVKDYKDVGERLAEAKYQYALALTEKKDWKAASSLFKELGDYQDSASRYKETYYQYGLKLLSSNSYSEAVSVFKSLENYQESKTKLNEAKYGYVLAHKNNTDTTTYSYLKDLKALGYKDTKDIYNSLYAWKVINIYFSTSESETGAKKTSISKYDPVYCHFELSGGPPGGSIYVYCKDIYPNGSSNGKDKTNFKYSRGYTGWFGWEDGIYQTPAYGATGTLTMKFYDEDGNLIGEGSVRIT